MNFEEFVEKYKPKENHLVEGASIDGFMFETYGVEWDFVRATDFHNVWTYVDTPEGEVLINGFHYVNRLGYLVCEVAWVGDENTYIEVNLEE